MTSCSGHKIAGFGAIFQSAFDLGRIGGEL
jgi:hypothetical protein